MFEHLPPKIKKIRESLGISQHQMAAGLNISQATWSKIESGESPLNMDRVLKISEVLNVSPTELLNLEGKQIVYNNFNEVKGGYNGNGTVNCQAIEEIKEIKKSIEELTKLVQSYKK